MIDGPVLMRFRTLVDGFRTANAAVQAIDRELNDRRSALFTVNAEIDRLKRDARAPWGAVAKAAQEQIDDLRDQTARAQAEIDRLAAERERLQHRRDDASAIVGRCRDFLMSRGVGRAELEA